MLDKPVNATYAGKNLKFRMYKAMTRLTQMSDLIDMPFYHIFQYYIAYKIQLRKGNWPMAQQYKGLFDSELLKNALADNIPAPDTYEYYSFEDPVYANIRNISEDYNDHYRF